MFRVIILTVKSIGASVACLSMNLPNTKFHVFANLTLSCFTLCSTLFFVDIGRLTCYHGRNKEKIVNFKFRPIKFPKLLKSDGTKIKPTKPRIFCPRNIYNELSEKQYQDKSTRDRHRCENFPYVRQIKGTKRFVRASKRIRLSTASSKMANRMSSMCYFMLHLLQIGKSNAKILTTSNC